MTPPCEIRVYFDKDYGLFLGGVLDGGVVSVNHSRLNSERSVPAGTLPVCFSLIINYDIC